MNASDSPTGLLPALLKHWRRQRGLSQLDLALAADVSSRHVSFIETGRSRPSPEMVLRLAATLGVSLDQTNELLRAAGHAPRFGGSDGGIPDAVAEVVALIGRYHEPFPSIVVDRTYRVLDVNRAAATLLGAVLGEAAAGDAADGRAAALGLNLARLTFDPSGAQPHIANFDEVGRQLLWRIQREALAAPEDAELRELLDALLASPTVPDDWRSPDLSEPSEPALVLHLRAGGLDLRFLTLVTAFQAPQNVAVEHLRIETWLPADAATESACRMLAGDGPTG